MHRLSRLRYGRTKYVTAHAPQNRCYSGIGRQIHCRRLADDVDNAIRTYFPEREKNARRIPDDVGRPALTGTASDRYVVLHIVCLRMQINRDAVRVHPRTSTVLGNQIGALEMQSRRLFREPGLSQSRRCGLPLAFVANRKYGWNSAHQH
jgi:hypothetical protein